MSEFPQLLKEYKIEKNGNLPAENIQGNSVWRSKVIIWTCDEGHEWKELLSARIHSDQGCPKCKRDRRTIKLEQDDNTLSYKYIRAEVANFMVKEKKIPGTTENLVIRKIYNAIQKGNKDIENNIQNWPHLLSIIIQDMRDGSIKKELKKQYQQKLYYNRKREWRPYGLRLDRSTQLKNKFPKIAKEIHPTMNYGKLPRKMHYEADTMLWWTCDLKHNYRMKLSSRTIKGKNCPICDFNDPKNQDGHKPKYFWQTLDPGYNYALQVIIDFFIDYQRVPAASENKSIFRIYKALRNDKVKKIWGVDSWSELLRMTIGNLGYELGDLRDKLIESYNNIVIKQKHLAWEPIIV